MNVNNSVGEDPGSEKHSRENINPLREHLHHHEQTITRNTDIKGSAGEGWEWNEEHGIGTC